MKESTREDLLDIIQDQHRAIDLLMAQLIRLDDGFLPSKSPVWPVIERAVSLLREEGRLP